MVRQPHASSVVGRAIAPARRHRAAAVASVLLAGAVAGAAAQDDAVRESTDPARAAAAEQRAREIRERIERDRRAGKAAEPVGVVRETTSGGVALLMGGITVEDRVAMHAERERFSLWISTLAKPSGAYLSDVRLRIVDAKDRSLVLDRTMPGPWLMAALPPGRYELVATHAAEDAPSGVQILSAVVGVAPRGLRQAVFRFDSTAQVSPEMERPLGSNPFADPARP
jgi:hypothetical protein